MAPDNADKSRIIVNIRFQLQVFQTLVNCHGWQWGCSAISTGVHIALPSWVCLWDLSPLLSTAFPQLPTILLTDLKKSLFLMCVYIYIYACARSLYMYIMLSQKNIQKHPQWYITIQVVANYILSSKTTCRQPSLRMQSWKVWIQLCCPCTGVAQASVCQKRTHFSSVWGCQCGCTDMWHMFSIYT